MCELGVAVGPKDAVLLFVLSTITCYFIFIAKPHVGWLSITTKVLEPENGTNNLHRPP